MSEHAISSATQNSGSPLPGGFAAISKYNPHLWTAEQLRAIFVARQGELADLQKTLSDLAKAPAQTVGQHVLIVGARGMGKSTLMQRLALAVEDDAQLQGAWLALRFPEEQYTVSTPGQFWANVLDSLADAMERQGQCAEAIAMIDQTAGQIASLPACEQAAACLKTINQIADQEKKRLLLLVDNTDLLLHSIPKADHWALREVLQSNPRLLWVGGSYQSLEANSEYHDAFLDFFRLIELRPLTLVEMQHALLALASSFGGEEASSKMQAQLKAQPERLATLRQLSGGNPRTTVMLYELFSTSKAKVQDPNSGKKQPRHVRSDLEALLDNMTPLYKSRLDALPELQRKLLAHILEHWAPMGLADLAKVSQVAKTSISPQLQRMELEGLIEKTRLHGTTRNGYQASERFFNIWYLMRLSPRRQRTRLGWFVQFLRLWFSGHELTNMARDRATSYASSLSNRDSSDLEYDRAIADALPDDSREKHRLRWAILKQLQNNREHLAEIFDFEIEDKDFKGADKYLLQLNELPALLRQNSNLKTNEERDEWVRLVMGSTSIPIDIKTFYAIRSSQLTRSETKQIKKVLLDSRAYDAEFLTLEATLEVESAILKNDFFPDCPDSKLAYQQIRAYSFELPKALYLAVMIHSLHHQDEWVLKSLDFAQTVNPHESGIEEVRADILHRHLKQYEKAEAAYRKAISMDDQVANTWAGWANLLHDCLNRYEEAKKAYAHALQLDRRNAANVSSLARLLANMDEKEKSKAQYFSVVKLATSKQRNLLLQAHLYLGNHQLAQSALTAITQKITNADTESLHQLQEQIWQCVQIGVGEALGDLMAADEHAMFLQPFAQACYTLAEANHKLQDLPLEIQQISDEVVRAAKERLKKPQDAGKRLVSQS